MDKTALTESRRLFILEALPEPLTPASAHLQIFDTYIPETRFRVRQMRDPATNNWTRLLQQILSTEGKKVVEMHLDDDEFALFERIRGAETRKNRYFHEFDGCSFTFDVYLGSLRGLITGKADTGGCLEYEMPSFAIVEVLPGEFFEPRVLAEKSFEDVQKELARLMSGKLPVIPED